MNAQGAGAMQPAPCFVVGLMIGICGGFWFSSNGYRENLRGGFAGWGGCY
jgi:hypothetical protein